MMIALFFVVLSVANAACPLLCSGHGSCGANDKCHCYPNFQGTGCDERSCPFELSWNGHPVDGQSHKYAECSNKGDCDREIGMCNCFEGFTGEACHRMRCPNDCSGKGQCLTLADIDSLYNGWDAEKIQSCVCDAGYFGADCGKRICKLGDDPHSLYDSDGLLEVNQIQKISIAAPNGFVVGDEIVISYIDWRKQLWTTRAIKVHEDWYSSNYVMETLIALPQRSIPEVKITTIGNPSNILLEFLVEFTSDETPGEQPILVVGSVGCQLHGCQPVYVGIGDTDATVTVTTNQVGTSERIECSGRGKCDYELGTCVCSDGNRGEACEKLTMVF